MSEIPKQFDTEAVDQQTGEKKKVTLQWGELEASFMPLMFCPQCEVAMIGPFGPSASIPHIFAFCDSCSKSFVLLSQESPIVMAQ